MQALDALVPQVEGDDVSIAALVAFLHTVALAPPGVSLEALPQWESWVRHRRSLRNTRAPFMHSDDMARLPGGHAPQLAAIDEFLIRLADFQRENEQRELT